MEHINDVDRTAIRAFAGKLQALLAEGDALREVLSGGAEELLSICMDGCAEEWRILSESLTEECPA